MTTVNSSWRKSPPKLSITYLWFFSNFNAVFPAARQWGPVDLQGKKTESIYRVSPTQGSALRPGLKKEELLAQDRHPDLDRDNQIKNLKIKSRPV